MLAIFATLNVKPEHAERFMKYLEADAEGSLREEGCLRFDLLRDEADPNQYYLYEVYRDAAAYALHQQAPYFKAFFAEAADTLACAPEVHSASTVFPREAARWAKR